MKLLYSFLLVFLFIIPCVHAQTIVTDRPDQTEAATVIQPSSFQIESGILIQTTDFVRTTVLPTNLFRVGVSNFLELRLVHEYAIMDRSRLGQDTQHGFNDWQAGFKLQLFNKEGKSTQVALLSHLVIPSGSDPEFTNNEYGVINKLAIAHDLQSRWSIGYNLGYDYLNEGFFTYAMAIGYGINDKVGLYFEPFGLIDEEGDHEANFDAGFTYLFKDNIQFDFSMGTGINVDMNYLAIGMSWQFFGANNE